MPRIQDDELLDAWREVWGETQFKGPPLDPIDEEEGFAAWLRKQPLDGAFRDLQHIAILVADYQRYRAWPERRSHGSIRNHSLLEWLDQEMKKRRPPARRPTLPIPLDSTDPVLTERAFLDECRRAFAVRMKEEYGGSQKAAVEALQARGSKMTEAKFSSRLNLDKRRA